MASQLGSAITPTGHQAYSDLLNTEMQNRAMAQNAMQNQQQVGIAQQRMMQDQGQFEAGLQEAQRQREHEMGREDLGYQRGLELQRMQQEFQAKQAEAYQRWQDQQARDAHSYELELENLKALRDEARDKGQAEMFEKYTNQMLEVRKSRAKKSMAVALGSRLVGKSQREIDSMIDMLSDNLGRQVGLEQQNQALAQKFAGSLVSRFDEGDRAASIEKYKQFKAKQEGGFDVLNPFSPNFGDIEAGVSTGALPGIEWLDLEPTNFGRLRGLDPHATTQAKAVRGYVDPATMSETIKGRLVEGTLQQLDEMGMKGINKDAARGLVQAAFNGSNKAEIARLASAANVPTTALKYLFDAAARAHEDTSNNERYKQLVADEALYSKEAGGQDDLKVMAIRKAREAYGAKSKLLRTAANAFDDMDLSDYNAAIEYLGQVKKTGKLSDLARSAFGKVGLGSEASRLEGLMARVPEAKQQLEDASVGLGDVEEESSALEALLPVLMMQRGVAGNSAYRAGIADLLGKYGTPR